MNDDEVITVVTEQRDKVHSATAVEQIISRGRMIRARRRIPGVAGALAVAAAAAVAVTTLLPSSHQPGHPAPARLAAWTVATQADGGIRVTIRELRNPAGLQRALRADGVPASVTFLGHLNPACQPYPSTGSKSQRRHLLASVFTAHPPAYHVTVIHPSALPAGAGVLISVRFDHYQPAHNNKGSFALQQGLVQASPHCTGS
jgi:hypothetical protein